MNITYDYVCKNEKTYLFGVFLPKIITILRNIVGNGNYKNVNISDILFKVNNEHIDQKNYMTLIYKERSIFLLLLFL